MTKRSALLLHSLGLVAVACLFLRAQVDPDAWWHLRVAGQILESHRLPTTDAISWWSGGTAWISPSWLNEVLLHIADSIYGPTGQSLLYLPIFVAVVFLVDRCMVICYPTMRSPSRLLALAFMAFALIPVVSPRAGNFDLLFSLFAIYGWLRFRGSGSTVFLWCMPLVAALWANLHGSGVMVYFALALAFAAGTVVDRDRFPSWRWRPFLASVALTYLALGLNGYGTDLYFYPWSTVFSSAQASTIAEWRGLDLAEGSSLGLRLILGLGLTIGLARARMKDAAGAFAVAGFLFLTLGGARYLLIAVPLLTIWYMTPTMRGLLRYLQALEFPTHVKRTSAFGSHLTLTEGHALLGIVGVVAIVAVIIAENILPSQQQAYFEATYPTRTLTALGKCNFSRVWTDYAWGGWTSYRTGWAVGPYGAADALGDARLLTAAAVEGLTTDPGKVFDELGLDAVVTQSNGPLAHWIAVNPAWRFIDADAVSSAFVRDSVPCRLHAAPSRLPSWDHRQSSTTDYRR